MALVLGTAVHLGWHLARTGGHLSYAWPLHWITAVPVFALTGWHCLRRWPTTAGRAYSIALTVVLGLILGQVAEALFEVIFLGGTLAYGFSAERLMAFAKFTAAGITTLMVMILALRANRPS